MQHLACNKPHRNASLKRLEIETLKVVVVVVVAVVRIAIYT
jgi:hypothetical protein